MPPYNPIYLPVPVEWPIPKFNLSVQDCSSLGAVTFFNTVQAPALLHEAVLHVLKLLYTPETAPRNVLSVTLILRSMPGVAYTKGSDHNNDHKEIHVSTEYIASTASRAHDEIYGVIVHEMVHCFQFNGKDTCPGGLIEGIADWVRLNAGFSPPHWKRGGTKWDDGYQNTGYFLDWIESQHGQGSVRRINESMRHNVFREAIFEEVTGVNVEVLWKEYARTLSEQSGDSIPVPTHLAEQLPPIPNFWSRPRPGT